MSIRVSKSQYFVRVIQVYNQNKFMRFNRVQMIFYLREYTSTVPDFFQNTQHNGSRKEREKNENYSFIPFVYRAKIFRNVPIDDASDPSLP